VVDLYGGIGPALGRDPREQDPELSDLRCIVVPLPAGRFYHFGSNRSLLTSTRELLEPSNDKRTFGHDNRPGNSPIVQDSRVDPVIASGATDVWIDNSAISGTLPMTNRHVLTNLPDSEWPAEIGEGICFDAVPLGNNRLCLRPYGFDDTFRGPIADVGTTWLSRPALSWFAARGILPEDAGFPSDIDLQEAPIFPVVDAQSIDAEFVRWLTRDSPDPGESRRDLWLESLRHSARELLLIGDASLLIERGDETGYSSDEWERICAGTDLFALSGTSDQDPPPPLEQKSRECDSLSVPRDRMYRAIRARIRGDEARERWEAEAFDSLRDIVVGQLGVEPATPTRNVLEDQIVWGRCPARLDLAGGWTDTPPYCLEFGGHIVNVAVDLNGQPPIQVFARCIDEPVIRIRSIDLGMEETVADYGALEDPEKLGSGFGIAKCALALAGFTPAFHYGGGGKSLRDQLSRELGGGLEVTQLAAIPKGSGLGTSSILAAALLGTLNDVLGLEWSRTQIFRRTLALEQMLGAGGGWQDQAGGMLPGLKRIDTVQGLSQEPEIQWLPHDFLGPGSANSRVLLYYTGLTRTAHDLLAEIVRGMFLNDRKRLSVLEEIGWNANFASKAILKNDWDGICESVRRSWILNQRIDAGTNPPAVQAIIEAAGEGLAACKLLGAGGGGYMLMLANDAEAGAAIRNRLQTNPPNQPARFVDVSVSETGFQVTRS
jgi:galactokinase/mevalonate kinase-like predicted kinase